MASLPKRLKRLNLLYVLPGNHETKDFKDVFLVEDGCLVFTWGRGGGGKRGRGGKRGESQEVSRCLFNY